jgi:hypothetical protein
VLSLEHRSLACHLRATRGRLKFAPSAQVAVGAGGDLPGLIRVYAYAGVFYYAETLVSTPPHEPFCSYQHLHGGPILAVPVAGVTAPPLSEMYGECGFGPTNALFWIPEPE